MPAPVADLIAEADRLLEPGHFEDYCVNGLQVPGPDSVETITTGVSAHVDLFERAAAERAQLLIVHHGLFWGPGVRTIDPPLKRRLGVLFADNIALAAYHLPLDAHPQLGNNALIARGLGATELEPFARHGTATIGFVAKLPEGGFTGEELAGKVHELTGREPLWFDCGPTRIERLAIVSGAGGDFIAEARSAGAQGLLTGEAPERSMADAREAGIHLLVAGHYATETFGVRALGEHLAERFSLRHVFIDVPNPL